ncbi:glycoside hydrolase family 31 protein [Natronorarus salvus]|uniref:glycoside hydrolase family 31 protein n=1 Tax=Natronorarus salvus TaxID=3117733 RepID=UPI002F262DB6
MPPQALSRVESHAVDGSRLRLDCEVEALGSGPEFYTSVPLTVEALRPDALRLTLDPHPEAGEVDSPLAIDYRAFSEPVDLSVTEGESSLDLSTDALSVRISFDPFGIEVREDDRTLVETQPGYRDTKGRPLVRPFGFTEEVVDNWPFGVSETHLSLRLSPDERIFGLGEGFGAFEKRGQRIETRVTQPNGVVSADTYCPVPFYLSDRGYGLFVDTASDVTFDVGATSPSALELAVSASPLSVTVFAGTPKEVLTGYTDLTGRAPSLPPWTFGTWLSRNTYETAEEVREVAREARERGFPCDVLHLDPAWAGVENLDMEWDRGAFPDPEALCADLHELGFRVSLWEYPYLPVESDRFAEAREGGYLVRDGSGRPYVLRRPSHPATRAGIVDFENPEAAAWWADRHRELIETGVDVFKTDFGEYLPDDAMAGGRPGTSRHNAYPLAYQRAVAGAFSGTEKPPVLFSRSGWAGCQRYPVHWGGDSWSTFDGFAASVRAGLSLTLSGFQFWSCDIGGYKPDPSPELYVRWAQWGLLALSHPRFHGKTPREPWAFGAEVEEIVTRYARLRYRLLPYLLTHAERSTKTGVPLTRAMAIEFPDEPAVSGLATQHMIGPDLLIAPVLSSDDRVRLTLPPGEWIGYFDGSRYRGVKTLDLSPALSEIPLFVRAGAAIPTGEPGDRVGSELADPVVLRVYLPEGGGMETETEVYDWGEERYLPIRVDLSEDRETLAFGCGNDGRSFEALVLGLEGVPNTITYGGHQVERDAVEFDSATGDLSISLGRG